MNLLTAVAKLGNKLTGQTYGQKNLVPMVNQIAEDYTGGGSGGGGNDIFIAQLPYEQIYQEYILGSIGSTGSRAYVLVDLDIQPSDITEGANYIYLTRGDVHRFISMHIPEELELGDNEKWLCSSYGADATNSYAIDYFTKGLLEYYCNQIDSLYEWNFDNLEDGVLYCPTFIGLYLPDFQDPLSDYRPWPMDVYIEDPRS